MLNKFFADTNVVFINHHDIHTHLTRCFQNIIFVVVSGFNMIKYTQNTLDKLENIPEQCGYILRYERGTFQSGYCILENKKVVVLNKFLQLEGRINTLVELIPQLEITTEQLEENSKKLYEEVMSNVAENDDVG